MTNNTPTPYPSRRKYVWSTPETVHTYEQARAIFSKMMRQAAQEDNPARYKTFETALEALKQLNHGQGVEMFPGPKLHRLLCKAALAAGWCTDLNTIQKYASNPVEVDKGMFRCPKCQEVKPLEDFLKKVSPSQRKNWGWADGGSNRMTKAKTCIACRKKAADRLRACSERSEYRKAVKAYDKAVTDGKITAQHVFDYWQAVFPVLVASGKTLRNKATHAPTLDFYNERLILLEQAKERFNHEVDCGHIDRYAIPSPHWTMFISDEALIELQFSHARMRKARELEGIRGRTPEL